MFRHNIIVRWANGELEGFSAFGFTAKAAEVKATAKARIKGIDINSSFELLTLHEYGKLTVSEKQDMARHWEISAAITLE